MTGIDCDKCIANHYGLDESNEGCKPCNCSPEGSHSTQCDAVTGQCQCKKNWKGKRCDEIESGYYCPRLDHHTYEAEYAEKLNAKVIDYKQNSYNYYSQSWSGLGYVRVYDGGAIKFNIKDIQASGAYEIIIRYESTETWRDVKLKIVKNGGYQTPSEACRRFSGYLYGYEKRFMLRDG